VPLFSDRNAIPLLRELELQASVRHDRYGTKVATPSFYLLSGGASPPSLGYNSNRVRSTDFTVAGKWAPIRDLNFRMSYATGFLPPAINQLVPNAPVVITSNTAEIDPLRGN